MNSNLNLEKIKFNIAHIKLSTKLEGPFNRCCIWFQGCNLHCEGCGNKELQSFAPKHILSCKQLIDIIIKAKIDYGIEGITISGGEPSLQTDLNIFNMEIHKLGLGIIMFSGKAENQLSRELLDSIDLLIDGPFLIKKPDNKRILLGSTNKRLIPITSRYKNELCYFNNSKSLEEVEVGDYIFINGD